MSQVNKLCIVKCRILLRPKWRSCLGLTSAYWHTLKRPASDMCRMALCHQNVRVYFTILGIMNDSDDDDNATVTAFEASLKESV